MDHFGNPTKLKLTIQVIEHSYLIIFVLFDIYLWQFPNDFTDIHETQYISNY